MTEESLEEILGGTPTKNNLERYNETLGGALVEIAGNTFRVILGANYKRNSRRIFHELKKILGCIPRKFGCEQCCKTFWNEYCRISVSTLGETVRMQKSRQFLKEEPQKKLRFLEKPGKIFGRNSRRKSRKNAMKNTEKILWEILEGIPWDIFEYFRGVIPDGISSISPRNHNIPVGTFSIIPLVLSMHFRNFLMISSFKSSVGNSSLSLLGNSSSYFGNFLRDQEVFSTISLGAPLVFPVGVYLGTFSVVPLNNFSKSSVIIFPEVP